MKRSELIKWSDTLTERADELEEYQDDLLKAYTGEKTLSAEELLELHRTINHTVYIIGGFMDNVDLERKEEKKRFWQR